MSKDESNHTIGLHTVSLPITDPETGDEHDLFLVGLAKIDHETYDRLFRSGDYKFEDVFRNPFTISPPQDFLEAANDERMQEFIDKLGEAIDAVAKSMD